MNRAGQSKTFFKLAEFDPDHTGWEHTFYVSVDNQEPLVLDDDSELLLHFEPKQETTPEQLENLRSRLDDLLDTVNFTVIRKRTIP